MISLTLMLLQSLTQALNQEIHTQGTVNVAFNVKIHIKHKSKSPKLQNNFLPHLVFIF